jgi:hypothetical protein
VDRSWAGLAGRPRAARDPRGIIQDCCGCWTPWPPRSAGWTARSPPWPSPTHGSRPHGPARDWPAHGHDRGRRDRRLARFPTARKLCAWAGLTPRWATPTAPSATATAPNRAHPGCAGSCRKPPRRPSATPCSPPPTPSWLGVGTATSPPPRSPVGCWPAPSTSSPSWKFHLNHRRRPLPGALAFPHEPAPGPPVLTEQPGSGRHRHADPIFGARMGACEPPPNSSPGLLPRRPRHHHNPATYPAPSEGRSCHAP